MNRSAKKAVLGCALGSASLVLVSPALAQQISSQAPVHTGAEEQYAPQTLTSYGMSITGGAGVTGFFDEDTQDYSGVGASWDVRYLMGTRSLIGVEFAYIGSSQNFSVPELEDESTLVGNGGEVAARVNILPGIVQPYAFGGFGVTHYAVIDEMVGLEDAGVRDHDNIFEFPLGIGVAFRYEGLVADLRGTVRPVANDSLLRVDSGNLHRWSTNLTAGVEF